MTKKSIDLEVILFFHGRRGVRKRYCPSDLPLHSIPHAPRLSDVVNPFHGRSGGRKRYCPSDLPLRSIPPRLTARCLPLTAAGGQGPQDNTAYGPCINPQ